MTDRPMLSISDFFKRNQLQSICPGFSHFDLRILCCILSVYRQEFVTVCCHCSSTSKSVKLTWAERCAPNESRFGYWWLHMRFEHSRSFKFKVIDFCTHRKPVPVCDLLLLINGHLRNISRLGDVVVRTLDLRPSRRWFESRSWHCLVISEIGDRISRVIYLGM